MVVDASSAARLLALLILAAGVSGCAQASPATSATSSPPPTSAAPPTVNEEKGSIAGQVLDSESLPIGGAAVGLYVGMETTTDPSGRFTFNDLAPKTYDIFVTRVGFEPAARKAEVKAGEVTHVNITMTTIALELEAYHYSFNRVYQIHVDHDYIGQVFNDNDINNSAVNGLRCSPCESVIHFEKNPTAVLSEAEWNTGPGPVNTQAYTEYWKDWTDTTSGANVCFVGFPANRASVFWTATCVTAAKGEDKLKQHIYGGFTTVSYEQKVSAWTTFGYGGELPEGFSALPPA